MSIIISLGIGLLILIVDKRQCRHIDELIKTQHKLTSEIPHNDQRRTYNDQKYA
jgi:hypothetical protein